MDKKQASEPNLEEVMIQAGIPIVTDSNGQLLVDETRRQLHIVGIITDREQIDRCWVQKAVSSGSCFIVSGSCTDSSTYRCVYGPVSRTECANYIRQNCNARDVC